MECPALYIGFANPRPLWATVEGGGVSATAHDGQKLSRIQPALDVNAERHARKTGVGSVALEGSSLWRSCVQAGSTP